MFCVSVCLLADNVVEVNKWHMVLFATVSDILLTGRESFSAVHTSKHFQTAWSDLLHIKRCFWIKIKQNCNILTTARFFIMINKINISKARCRHDNSTEMIEKGWKSGSRLNYAVKKTETYGQQMRWRACGTGWVGSSHRPTFGRLQHRYPAWHRWPRCYRTWPLGFR